MECQIPTVPGMAYIAVPYTGMKGILASQEELEFQFKLANGVSGFFMSQGEIVFSPISHSHPIHFYMGDMGVDHDYWMAYNWHMAQLCNRIYIICSEDWKKSKGVMMELKWFREASKPVFLVSLLGGGRLGLACPQPGGLSTFPHSVEDRAAIVERYNKRVG